MNKYDEDYNPITYISTEYDPGVTANYSSMISTQRNLLLFILLSIITVGIYPIYFFYKCGRDIDIIAMKDGRRMINFVGVFFLSCFTVIPMYIWGWHLSDRIQKQLIKRECSSPFRLWIYIVFVIVIPIVAAVVFLFFFFLRETFQSFNFVWLGVGCGLVATVSFFIFLGMLMSAMNELSRCLKYKSVQV